MGGRKRAAAPSLVQQSKQLAAAHKRQKLAHQHQRDKDQLVAQRKQATKQSKARSPYQPHHTILLIGEGNFSFARSLITAHAQPGLPAPLPGRRLTATCYDSFAVARDKYADAQENIDALRAAGARVWDCIDATQLHSDAVHFPSQPDAVSLLSPPPLPHYDFVVFNFPHTGCGITDTLKNNRLHQQLLTAFLHSLARAPHLLSPTTRVHITLKTGEPYTSWHLPLLPRSLPPTIHTTTTHTTNPPNPPIHFITSLPFWPHLYPYYRHRRTIGFKDGLSAEGCEEIGGGAMTYVFMRTMDATTAGAVAGGGRAVVEEAERNGDDAQLLTAVEQGAESEREVDEVGVLSALSESGEDDEKSGAAEECATQQESLVHAVEAAADGRGALQPTRRAPAKVSARAAVRGHKRKHSAQPKSKLNLRGLLFT